MLRKNGSWKGVATPAQGLTCLAVHLLPLEFYLKIVVSKALALACSILFTQFRNLEWLGFALSSHWDGYSWQMQHTQSQDNISMEQGISLDQVQSRVMTSAWDDLVRANGEDAPIQQRVKHLLEKYITALADSYLCSPPCMGITHVPAPLPTADFTKSHIYTKSNL